MAGILHSVAKFFFLRITSLRSSVERDRTHRPMAEWRADSFTAEKIKAIASAKYVRGIPPAASWPTLYLLAALVKRPPHRTKKRLAYPSGAKAANIPTPAAIPAREAIFVSILTSSTSGMGSGGVMPFCRAKFLKATRQWTYISKK